MSKEQLEKDLEHARNMRKVAGARPFKDSDAKLMVQAWDMRIGELLIQLEELKDNK